MKSINLTSTKAENRPSILHGLGADNSIQPNQGSGSTDLLLMAAHAKDGSIQALLRRTGVLLAAVLISTSALAYASDDQSPPSGHADWQINRLMTPTASQRAAESRGQVFIYDSLDLNQVEKAMDANFDRIENMMFTRVYHPAPTPDTPAYLIDDGCD
jgi:hypothetical protein